MILAYHSKNTLTLALSRERERGYSLLDLAVSERGDIRPSTLPSYPNGSGIIKACPMPVDRRK